MSAPPHPASAHRASRPAPRVPHPASRTPRPAPRIPHPVKYPERQMIRLLALDIDGTLLDSNGHLPPANRDAIARTIDSGVEVALATGRRYEFARPIFE